MTKSRAPRDASDKFSTDRSAGRPGHPQTPSPTGERRQEHPRKGRPRKVWRGGLRRERPSGQGLDFYPRTGGGFGSVLSCTLELTRIRTMVQLFETELWRQFCRVQSHLRTKTNDPIDPEAEIPSLESVKAGAFCLVAHAVNAQELQHERDIMVSK